ncbi:MAG: LapA family protein [Desulfobacterales bacterium]
MIRNIIFMGLIIFVLIFVVQNTQVVEFRFLVWTISMSRALMLFGALAIGLAAGWLLKAPKRKNPQPEQRQRKK